MNSDLEICNRSAILHNIIKKTIFPTCLFLSLDVATPTSTGKAYRQKDNQENPPDMKYLHDVYLLIGQLVDFLQHQSATAYCNAIIKI